MKYPVDHGNGPFLTLFVNFTDEETYNLSDTKYKTDKCLIWSGYRAIRYENVVKVVFAARMSQDEVTSWIVNHVDQIFVRNVLFIHEPNEHAVTLFDAERGRWNLSRHIIREATGLSLEEFLYRSLEYDGPLVLVKKKTLGSSCEEPDIDALIKKILPEEPVI